VSEAAAIPAPAVVGRIRPVWRRPLAIAGAVIALMWLVVATFAPLIAPYDPLAQTFTALQPPSLDHPFGTDELGRDVLSRVIYGARVSIPLALLLVFLAATIGWMLGAIAGYFRGIADGTVMRVTDLVFAFPAIILAMVVTAVLGRGLRNAVLAIVIVAWPAYARVVRGLVLSIGDSEYVQSARLLGVSSRKTLFRDVLPNVAGPVLVLAAFNVSLLARYTRSSVLEVMGNDYVRAARAKGVPERVVLWRYVLRAALPAIITVIGLLFANILTGAVLVENIFSWPGLGQYAYQAAVNLDVPAIAGVSLFIAVVYVTINFVVDVLYGVIDPRFRGT
jgi:peptide/nickel transport system permease protein